MSKIAVLFDGIRGRIHTATAPKPKPARIPDPRNPFDPKSRVHAYFQALLDGNGRATYAEMVERCHEFRTDDDVMTIRRDLNNQMHSWGQGRWGITVITDDSAMRRASGERARGCLDRMLLTCTEVNGVPWARCMMGEVSG